MRRRLISFIFTVLLMTGTALAQNQDVGILFGIAPGSGQSTVAGTVISGSNSVNGQIDYSAQFRASRYGSFYVEVPLAISYRSDSVIRPGLITSADLTALYLTPGIRWKFWAASRVSFYAAAGGGLASYGLHTSVVGPVVSSASARGNHPAADFAGGVDIRISRLISLRGEGRDYVTKRGLAGVSGYNHSTAQLGIGFHF